MASSSESSDEVPDYRNEDDWEDAEPDQEDFQFVSLFDQETFFDLGTMFKHCKEKYDLDFLAVQKTLGLDFYGRIKLVNYLRSEVKSGNTKPDVSSAQKFADDKYLQPVLENDAVLFSLDELEDIEAVQQPSESTAVSNSNDSSARIKELEGQMQKLELQFSEYRKVVQDTLEKRWQDLDRDDPGPSDRAEAATERDAHYFDSYSYNDIHETMLKDTIRTDAYRDFIYENKHLFEGKTVLDVGCGTGILSMFCAKAGAAQVFAVDNSDIIDKARQNVAQNGFAKKITCIRGKIEEITLPVDKVDIIVSEWMGYCLLFEAMLNSVLWARDKYLRPDGLMVPSHCVLHVAPLIDADYVSENIEFWYDVYGFDMTAMMDKIYDDVLVRSVKTTNLAGKSSPFLTLPLHTCTIHDLTFTKDFSVTIDQNIETLDGWIIWFDTFFLRSPTEKLPADARAEEWKGIDKPGVAFTTGPGGKETHWHSGVMLMDRKFHPPEVINQGAKISGTVGYKEAGSNKRGLEIEIRLKVEAGTDHGKQIWFIS